MIIFIKGPIETLNYFAECMAEDRQDTIMLNFCDQGFYKQLAELDNQIDETTIVIIFNNVGIRARINNEELYYWEKKKARVYDIMVDHPINYLDTIAIAYPGITVLTVDGYHRDFIRNNFIMRFGQIPTYFLPLAGRELGGYGEQERDIDVLYVGRCQGGNILYQGIDFMRGEELEFYDFCYRTYRAEPYVQVDDVVDLYIKQYEKEYTLEQRMALISMVSMTVEHQVMHDLKMLLMRKLAEAGIHICIYGDNWEKLKEEYPDRITLGGTLDSEGCIQQMCRAKIELNMQPFFTYGGHDRVYNSMLNGAVCVSNRSRYLEQQFKDEWDIIFVDFNNMDGTVEKVKRVLNDKGKWLQMRERAYVKARKDTWKERLRQIEQGNFMEVW